MGLGLICLVITIGAFSIVKIYQKITNGVCRSTARLDGKIVVITGANSGIGKQTAVELATRGACVIMGCRNMDTGQKSREEIMTTTGNKQIYLFNLDFSSLESVRNFSQNVHDSVDKVHILINNAGAAGLGNYVTDDGLQVGMQVNHFGPFLLTNLLLDLIIKAAPSRIITVSSMLHKLAKLNIDNLNDQSLSDFTVYYNSKLCNILMSNELARKLEGVRVTSNSLHPGAVQTELFQHVPQPMRTLWNLYALLFFKSVKEGAQTTIYLAVAEEVSTISGEYFADCVTDDMSEAARDQDLAQKLWELSEQYVKLSPRETYS